MDYLKDPWPETAELLKDVLNKFDELSSAVDTATMARTPFELRYFVAGRHVHPMQQFRQLLTEMQVAEGAIKSCIIGKKKRRAEYEMLNLEIEEIEKKITAIDVTESEKKKAMIEVQLKKYKQEELELGNDQENRAMAGKLKEVGIMYNLITTEYKEWLGVPEMKQLENERNYWIQRLARQAANEVASCGAISTGMIEVIRQLPDEEKHEIMQLTLIEDTQWHKWMGKQKHNALVECARLEGPVLPYKPVNDGALYMKLRKNAPPGYPENLIANTERIDIVIGVLHRNLEKDMPISEHFEVPTGKNWTMIRLECPAGELIGDYKNRLALHAESLGATHLFVLDDDVEAPQNIIRLLYNHNLDIVGAWYPKKIDPPESASMILKNGVSEPAPDGEGLIECNWSLTAGCTLYKLEALQRMPKPWFKTTEKGTEDTWLTRLAMRYGIKSYLDRNIKVKHIDKKTGKVFEMPRLLT